MKDLCKRNILILNLFTVCVNAAMFVSIRLPFFQDVLGLDFHDLLIAESIYSCAIIILDVPTGWFADRFGRRKSLMGGAISYAIGMLMISVSSTFWHIGLAYMIVALGVSLMNGANAAMLYDTLLSAGRESEYRKREGFRFGLQFYSCALSCIAGVYLYPIDPHLPLWIHAGFLMFAVFLALLFVEPARHKRPAGTHPLKDIGRTIHYITRGHAEIGALILLMMIVFATCKICLYSIQPYTAALGLSMTWNGWVTAGVMLLGAVSGHLGHLLLPDLHGRKALYMLGGFLGACVAFAGLGLTWVGLVCLAFESFVFCFGMPRAQEAINNIADSSVRATILSTASLSTALGFVPLSQLVGWMTDEYGIEKALLANAGIVFVLGLIAAIAIERRLSASRFQREDDGLRGVEIGAE